MLGRCLTVARMRLVLSALAIALTIAGCSSYATPDKSASTEAEPIKHTSRAYKTAVAYPPQSRTHGYHRTLEATLLAPNCELTGPEPDTIDADLWARLKLDYERHCYKQAETSVRTRLRRLLASGRCDPTASALAANVVPVPTADSADGVDVPPLSPADARARGTSEGVEAPVKDAEFVLEQGVAAYHNGDVALAIADFTLATRFDPNFKSAYIDRGIALYRMSEFNRAFADIAKVMRIENSRRIEIPPLPKTSPLSNKN
jgi:tetratricopeptide (TPR) repeat protein